MIWAVLVELGIRQLNEVPTANPLTCTTDFKTTLKTKAIPLLHVLKGRFDMVTEKAKWEVKLAMWLFF
jgi:hypothetical protein